MQSNKRWGLKGVLGVSAAAGGSILFAAAAWACTNLATLNLSNATGAPGSQVTLTGSSFTPSAVGKVAPPVVLHFNSLTGPALATVHPNAAGDISATFIVPQAQPGDYVIVATQTTSTGTAEFGTPARASLVIPGPAGATASQPATASLSSSAPTTSSSGDILGWAIGLGAGGLALFGAGLGAVARQGRRREVPATAPVRKD
ncbi:MAG: hypothetical protein ACRDX8_07690 [Acidimicrobiales bacterium]